MKREASMRRENLRRDELLETLWRLKERGDLTLGALRDNDPSGECVRNLHDFSNTGVLVISGETITLTDMGLERARQIIRRHRLAERLVADALGKEPGETESAACEFEHILVSELEESICILLGHPRTCPHGSPIPEGACCLEAKRTTSSAVMTLRDMNVGESAKVVMVNTTNHERMEKLLALGVNPGVTVKVLQKSPVLVIEIGHSQIAMEPLMGGSVNVWRRAEP